MFNFLISTLFGFGLTLGLLLASTSLGLMVVLSRRGVETYAPLRYIYQWRTGLSTQYAFEYVYIVNGMEYKSYMYASSRIESWSHKKTKVRTLLYLPEHPEVNGDTLFPFARYSLMFTLALIGWFFATMLSILFSIKLIIVYPIWIVIIIVTYFRPELTKNPKFRSFYVPLIPEKASRIEVDDQGLPLVNSK